MEINSLSNKEDILINDLSRLEGYIETFWHSLPVPACYVTEALNIFEVSVTLVQLTGFNENELLGANISIILPGFKIPKKVPNQGEAFIKTKNNDSIPVKFSLSPRLDENNQTAGYFVVLTDLRAHRAIEQELKEKVLALQQGTKNLKQTRSALMNILEDVHEERKKAEEERDRTMSIISNFDDGLLLLEAEKVVLINPQAKKLFSIEGKDVVGQEINSVLVESFKPLIDVIKQKGFKLSREEVALLDHTPLEVSVMPVKRDGKEVGKIIILHNMTREKALEQMKTEFVSIAAHQLRTPLSGIKWILRMLLDGDMGALSVSQKEFLGKTYQNNERMIRLVNDLLNVARIEEGRFLHNIKKEDLVSVAVEQMDILKEEVEKNGLEFRFVKPEGGYPKAQIDKEKIFLVIQNLVDNAINYTKKGFVELKIEFKAKEKIFRVSVKDSGMGIAKSQKARMFSKFFRGSNAIKADTEGTGLGLFIAKNIVQAHGGEIGFTSEEQQGSEFFFTLPILQQ